MTSARPPPPLAAKLRRGFPKSLNGAPRAMLPMSNSGLRRSLEKWFHAFFVGTCCTCGEFYDPAFVNVLALHGLGFMSAPTIVVKEIVNPFWVPGDRPDGRVSAAIYAITPERKLTHPAVTAITSDAHRRLFAKN